MRFSLPFLSRQRRPTQGRADPEPVARPDVGVSRVELEADVPYYLREDVTLDWQWEHQAQGIRIGPTFLAGCMMSGLGFDSFHQGYARGAQARCRYCDSMNKGASMCTQCGAPL